MLGGIPSLPQYAFVAWRLVKHRDNFTFTFNCVIGIIFELLGTVECWQFVYIILYFLHCMFYFSPIQLFFHTRLRGRENVIEPVRTVIFVWEPWARAHYKPLSH
jgi:hypothetical protein